MRSVMLLGMVLCGLLPGTCQANGFGLFRRPVETRPAYYYVAPVIICPPGTPGFANPAPRFQPTAYPVAPYAIPFAAPPSSQEPPLSPARPMMGESTTALRPGDAFFSLLMGPVGMPREDGRCSVAFWNLTGRALTVRIDSREHVLPAGRNVTLDLPRSFAWQIAGRGAEASRINDTAATAEVLIRR